MKKSIGLRIGLICACLALVTSFFVGSTLAKYTAGGTDDDSATVAKWGVTVTNYAGTGDSNAFKKQYATTDSAATGITNSVDVTSTKTLAPGTNGTLVSVTVSGQPEVAVKITKTANLTLTGWTVDSADYMPVVFTVGSVTYQMGSGTDSATAKYFGSVADLEAAVEQAITGGSTTTSGSTTHSVDVAANTDLANNHDVTVTWAWAFEGASGAYQTDAKDTKLADLASLPTISISVTTTVTQID